MLTLATTTVTVARPAGDGDPYEAAATTTLATAVPGHITGPTATDIAIGGAKETITGVLLADMSPEIRRGDLITDDTTGLEHIAAWSMPRRGLGLDHQRVGLRLVRGGANG